MARGKTRNGVPNRHLHARISYLHQAATYLSLQQDQNSSPRGQHNQHQPASTVADEHKAAISDSTHQNDDSGLAEDVNGPGFVIVGTSANIEGAQQVSSPTQGTPELFNAPPTGGLPHQLSSHLLQVARRSQIRLHPSIKHSICRRCNSILVDGNTVTKYVQNLSRGGEKAHADVLVVKCTACGAMKRFPLGAVRQAKGKKAKKSRAREEIRENSDRDELIN